MELVHKGADAWNDFSDVDIVLGLREIGSRPFNTKPPTKLINSWLAGVPFIGGADSAYMQIGSPGFDYLRVTSREQLAQAIETLKQDSAYSQRMVERGAVSGQAYRSDVVTERWAELIESTLHPLYCAQMGGSPRLGA